MDAAPIERVYCVLSGTLTVIDEDGQRYVLNPMDSLYIPPNVKRRIINETNMPVTMLVIASYPEGGWDSWQGTWIGLQWVGKRFLNLMKHTETF
jgi:quercetin dioxygenase-like cupin family protein